jgi:hypothetical protein
VFPYIFVAFPRVLGTYFVAFRRFVTFRHVL